MRQVQKQSWHHRIQDVKCHVKSGKQVSKQSQQTLLTHSSLVSSLLPAQPLAPQNHSLSTPGHSMTAQRNNPCTAWYMMYMLYTPLPSVYIPPPLHTFPSNVWEVGGGRWSRSATERGAKKVYTLWFFGWMRYGGTCLAPAQNNIWQTPKMYSSGGWAATMNYQFMAS